MKNPTDELAEEIQRTFNQFDNTMACIFGGLFALAVAIAFALFVYHNLKFMGIGLVMLTIWTILLIRFHK